MSHRDCEVYCERSVSEALIYSKAHEMFVQSADRFALWSQCRHSCTTTNNTRDQFVSNSCVKSFLSAQ